MTLFIPSPSISNFQIGPLTIHIYALCLIAGIFAGWTLGVRRWRARGGTSESFETVLLWTIPLAIVGARIYHVLTHLGDYFGAGATQHWWAIWEGGIAIYGAVGAGALVAWLTSRRQKVSFPALADAIAPGIALGQALGRFGNWFNQELYGQPTTLPWGLEIDPAHRAPGFEQYETFHPTFLYESLWNLFVMGTLLWADKRFRLGRGKVFALYVALYGFGRIFTEHIRLDYSYDTFGSLRFNEAVAILICLIGVAALIWLVRFRPGREEVVEFGAADGSRPDRPADEQVEEPAEEPGADPDGSPSTSSPDTKD
ncbi:MAG TPA: prolipoprotein diacylglyceryl transferase [Propionicimonas sp.]|nr:prolipoprotein diacylglyceryl transferase [Propionicimonas sp.]HQD97509.1 prolipoprotein diacylglyceryl transferase [Propionicimonas sp.]